MKKSDRIILVKMIEEAHVLAQSLEGYDESAFLANEDKKRASSMTLINIGELVKNLSIEFRNEHKSIPWKEIAGFRDVAAHGYFTLRMDDVWIYASLELPRLSEKIRKILDDEEKTD